LSQDPANPVNAMVITARVMVAAGTKLWLQAPDDEIMRAWAPRDVATQVPPNTEVEVYLGADGALNGWWDRASGLAINQRLLELSDPPKSGDPVVCQGECGLVWLAPAAESFAEQDEQCLTCGGRLAPPPV